MHWLVLSVINACTMFEVLICPFQKRSHKVRKCHAPFGGSLFILIHRLVCVGIRLHTEFEMPSLSCSKNTWGSQNLIVKFRFAFMGPRDS